MYRNKKNGIIGIIITIIILILVVIFSNGETNSNFIENSSAYNLSQFINKQITLPKQIEFHPELENLKQHRLRFNF